MDFTHIEPEDVVDLPHRWFTALSAVSRRARQERFGWPVFVDEFELRFVVERRRRPTLWGYLYLPTGGEIIADSNGTTYRFIPYRSGPQLGRFQELGLRAALWRSGLPRAALHTLAHRSEAPPAAEAHAAVVAPASEHQVTEPRARVRGRRRQLRVVPDDARPRRAWPEWGRR